MQSRRNCVTTCTNSLKRRGKGGLFRTLTPFALSFSDLKAQGNWSGSFGFTAAHAATRSVPRTDRAVQGGSGHTGHSRAPPSSPQRFALPSAARRPPPSAPSAAGPARASHIQTAERSLTVTLAPQCHFESNGRRGEPRPRDSAHQSRAALGFRDPNSSFDWLLAALPPPPTRPPVVSPPLRRGAFLIGR